MRRIKNSLRMLRQLSLPEWSALALVFAVCFYCFGLLLSQLGFFQDDWHHVFQAYWYGVPGLQRFLLTDRGPFAYLIYAFFFRILGFAPAPWHWSLMVLRFLTAAMFWLCARQIWPGHSSLAGWLALLFTVYPIFTLQPLAVAYTLHWSTYFLFMLSLFLMLLAVRHPKAFVPLTAAAIVLEAFHLICIEYYSGLELSRPIFLWLLLGSLPARDRWRKSLRYSLPYLIVLLLYAVYRSSYVSLYGFDRFGLLAALTDLVHSPLGGLQRILQFALQDFIFVIFSQWYSAIDPQAIDLSRASTYAIMASVIAFGVVTWFVMTRSREARSQGDIAGLGGQVAGAGLLSVVLALLPFWITGLSIYQKNQLWSDRLALSAMPGASMLATGLVILLIERPAYRNLVLSGLVGLGISLPFQTARSFQASWDKQEQFYWQLHWRAPALQPNTLVASDQEILFYMGVYPTAFAINMLYPQAEPWPAASYWFNAGMEGTIWDKFIQGEPVTIEKHTETFTATLQDVLAITFEPGSDQCLWVLRPAYANLRDLSAQAQPWLKVSNLARIQQAPEAQPPAEIFGKEPAHEWCYYYEKADLAAQFQQWDQVIKLWGEASKADVRPRNSVEAMPFIEAYARVNDWESAGELTTQAGSLPDRSASVLCDLWSQLVSTTAASSEREQAVSIIEGRLDCQR